MNQSAKIFAKKVTNALRVSLIVVLMLFMNAHSLKAQLKQATLNQIEALKWKDLDSAISFLGQENISAENQGNKELSALFSIEISKAYNMKRDCDSIKLWFQKASKIFDQFNDNRGKAEVLFQEGYWHYCQGQYEEALALTLEGLSIMESISDTGGIALGYLRLSRIYHFTYKLNNSAKTGITAGRKFEEVGDFINAADGWSFAGHGYRVNGEFDLASDAFSKSLQLAKKSGVKGVLGIAFTDLAAFYRETQNYDSAEHYFIEALDITNPQDERQIMVIKTGLCQVYLATEEYEKCIQIGEEALQTVLKTNDVFFLSELPEYLAKAYEGLNQYDSAYKYMKMNWIYSDSLFTASQEKALQEMQVKYETEKKDQLLSEQKKNFLVVLGFGLLMVILIGVLLIFYTKQKKHNKKLIHLNQELDKKNNQNELLLKEIHHRVKNNLEMVKSLIALQSAHLEDSKTRDAMLASQNRVQSMGIIHQKLYQGDNLGSIEMRDYFINLGEGILDSFNAEAKVKIECIMEKLDLDIDTAVPLGLIVNELLTNAIKYAFPKNIGGVVQVSLKKENDALLLDVNDNGVGKHGNEPMGTGFGTQLVQLLTTQLNGKMEEESEGGTHISFTFKLNTAA